MTRKPSDRKTTQEDKDQIVLLNAEGLTVPEMEARTGIKHGTIRYILKCKGLQKKDLQHRLNRGEKALVEELFREGKGPVHIAGIIGTSESTIRVFLDKVGLRKREPQKRVPHREEIVKLRRQGVRALGV